MRVLSWLSCFPSFGFLLALPHGKLSCLQDKMQGHDNLICRAIGSFNPGPAAVGLQRGGQTKQLWDDALPLTGFRAVALS